MATRSIIAVGTRQDFKGVYCHFDGYGVDQDLVTIFHAAGKEHAQETLRFLIDDHPEGWSSVLTDHPGDSDWPNVRIPHTTLEGRAYKDRQGDNCPIMTFTQEDIPEAVHWMDYLHIINPDITTITVYGTNTSGRLEFVRTTLI